MTELASKIENVATGKVPGPGTTDTGPGHGFEPEVLAFCCEH
jgi:hypothetical protein